MINNLFKFLNLSLLYQVSYECAKMIRENFTGISSSLLNTLINNAPSVAFLDQKKVCKMKASFSIICF